MGSDGLSRADQYGLAATMFHLLTGAPPFDNESPVTVIGQHLNAEPPRLGDRHPELAELDDVMRLALAKNPADRFRNCCEFVGALTHCLDGSTAERPPESVRTVIRAVKPQPVASTDGSVGRLAKLTRSSIVRPVIFGSAVATAVAGSVLVAHLMSGRHDETASTIANPPAGAVASTPSDDQAALDGTYRLDANRAGGKYNGVPNPEPPNVSTWWAVRTSCTPIHCTATGVMLNNDDHHILAGGPGADTRLVLDFTDGQWLSRPETLQFACVSGDGKRGTQTTTQAVSLQPTIQGVLHGAIVVTVETDECGQRGAQIWTPAVATRLGDAPTNITLHAGAAVPITPAPATPVG